MAHHSSRSFQQTESISYRKTVLSSGVRVISEYIPTAQSFSLGVWAEVGSRHERPREHGAAHFLEHIVFRGTPTRSAKRIATELESLGAYLNAFTTKDHICLYVRALTRHFEKSLAVLADVAQNPLFAPRDLEKERAVILEEMRSLEDEPEEEVADLLDLSLFGAHPLAHPISGTPESVSAITREDLQAFHKRFFHPKNLVVAIAGNIDHNTACILAESLFARRTERFRKRSIIPPTIMPPQYQEITRAVQQAHIHWGIAFPELGDKDYYTLSIINMLFGDGMSSRLNQTIREKHSLAYTVYSAIGDMTDATTITLYAATEAKNRTKTEQLLRHEIDKLVNHAISKAEFQRAKEQLKSNIIIGLESLSGRMNMLEKSEFYLGRYESAEEKLAWIDSISLAETNTFAHERLGIEHWHTAVIVPED